ncbi:MAG: STM4013/SEN3800 family hydrolase [Lentisphaerales bacterium]|nr:STM4013/SEN3800 family hydrolase [Lentisphaerales bacterium]
MNQVVKSHNVLFMTFDTLRFDVADELCKSGRTPNLSRLFNSNWQKRHSPGSFTYASHQAFFAGFLPTPATPGLHPRLFACAFEGSATSDQNTLLFEEENIIKGFAQLGFKTVCIGGVGFFKKNNGLSSVIPNMFDESYWNNSLGVTCKESPQNQFNLAAEIINNSRDTPMFLFINLSALHQPNNIYLNPDLKDSKESHAAALVYIDSQLPLLESALKSHGNWFSIFTSDHGTTYGEDGFTGHRLSNEHVWTVPYKEFFIGDNK